jgi:hypothetical protein
MEDIILINIIISTGLRIASYSKQKSRLTNTIYINIFITLRAVFNLRKADIL